MRLYTLFKIKCKKRTFLPLHMYNFKIFEKAVGYRQSLSKVHISSFATLTQLY